MDLATTLTKDEVQKSLKVAIKRCQNKKIPPPKYLCTPTSHQFQQGVTILDENHVICDELNKLLNSHGTIPKLRNLSIEYMKSVYASQKNDVNSAEKLSMIRHHVVRHMKTEFLSNPCHRLFWSFVHIGANCVMRHLETLRTSETHAKNEIDQRLSVVLLDSGWLNSQLGHHIAHLCAIHDVRLIAFRPVQGLANLISTDLYTMKKALAIGVSLSSSAPSELCAWVDQVRKTVTPLVLPTTSNSTLAHSTTLAKASVEQSDQKSMKTPDTQLWDNYLIDHNRLYLPTGTQVPSDRIVTLSDLWQRISEVEANRASQCEFDWMSFINSDVQHVCYSDAVVRIVPGQTEVERKKNKKKKTKKRSQNNADNPATPSKSKKRKLS